MQQREALFRRPRFVCVDAQRSGVARADRVDGFELSTLAEFDLDDRMRADLAHLLERFVERRDPDRKRRDRRTARIDSEQTPQRTIEILADAVVQRDIESAGFGRAQPAQKIVERVGWIFWRPAATPATFSS